MKKFTFSLERVLQIRIDKEKEAILEVNKAKQKLLSAEEELKSLKETEAQAKSEVFRDTFLARQNLKYIEFLGEKIEEQESLIVKLTEVLIEKKEELKKRNIDKKSLERLKEIKLNEYTEEMERAERLMNDEFALNAHNLKNLKGGE